jgi:ribosomal protein L37E
MKKCKRCGQVMYELPLMNNDNQCLSCGFKIFSEVNEVEFWKNFHNGIKTDF